MKNFSGAFIYVVSYLLVVLNFFTNRIYFIYIFLFVYRMYC